ncbi:MAG: type III PLP-dependent enzyme [Selenomonadaceae bacterium]|jgi:ornithine decarboxylase
MKTFRLTKEQTQILAEKYQTPMLTVSLDQIECNYRFLRRYLPRARVFYAMKANPAKPILAKMIDMGSSFDVASAGEMQLLHEMGVSGERMIYANPVKTVPGLRLAAEYGVNKFTFDSESEIYKMATHVPGSKVLLRVRIDHSTALVDLNKKFGAAPESVLPLLRLARAQGLEAAGLCFHVGSQLTSTQPYIEAFHVCRRLFDEAAAEGFDLKILDIGGGLPVPAPNMEFDLTLMAAEISEEMKRLFPETEIWSEPGRFICGTAVNFITSVIGTQTRNNQPWYFLDDGIYGALSGILFDHWVYEFENFKNGPQFPATFAGPSCDSIDILYRDRLTTAMEIGDYILVPNFGAYTVASATTFNGFEIPQIIVWEEIKEVVEEEIQSEEIAAVS